MPLSGNTCCTSMRENNPPPPALQGDARALLEEVARLQQALEKQGQPSDALRRTGLILAKRCAGLNLDLWDAIAAEGQFQDWLALPADGGALPHLMRMQRIIEELAHQNRQDPLTGLANRRAFEKHLHMELDRSQRTGSSLSLAMMDLDDFKAVNDTFGHVCGDRVLVALAGILLAHKRAYDMAARFGGEEFVLILPGSGLAQAESSLERLMEGIRQHSVLCDAAQEPVRFTCSIGLACTKGKVPMSVERFIDLADKALYEAKAQGKNRIVKASIPDLAEAPQTTLVLAQEKQFLFTGPDT